MHEVNECCWRIRQSKGHHRKLKVPITRPERCLRDICLPNPQLMVTSAKVYLGVDSWSSQLIKQIVDVKLWRKIPVFTQEKEFVIKLLKILSLYELQCSSYNI